MTGSPRTASSGPAPIRFRAMIIGLAAVMALIAVPLLVVWKQAYITGVSLRLEKKNDTLSSLNRRIAALRLANDRLSTNERIETIAREALGLNFPSSEQIVVIPVQERRILRREKKMLHETIAALAARTSPGSGR